MGKKVLLVDCDPQASLTISLGYPQLDKLPCTLSTLMGNVMTDEPIISSEAILHHAEGIDLLPASIELSGMEVSLVNTMSRETMLRQVLEPLKRQYDYILIDCIEKRMSEVTVLRSHIINYMKTREVYVAYEADTRMAGP